MNYLKKSYSEFYGGKKYSDGWERTFGLDLLLKKIKNNKIPNLLNDCKELQTWKENLNINQLRDYCNAASTYIRNKVFDSLDNGNTEMGLLSNARIRIKDLMLEITPMDNSFLSKQNDGIKVFQMSFINIGNVISIVCKEPSEHGIFAWAYIASYLGELNNILPKINTYSNDSLIVLEIES